MVYSLPIDEQGINRRWDPTGLEHDGEIALICLAASYNGAANWWAQPNHFELWRGQELIKSFHPGGMLSAAHLVRHDGGYVLYYGRNLRYLRSELYTPDQRLYCATSNDLLEWEWDKELGIVPPQKFAYKGYYALRDPHIILLSDGVWAMFVTTGGMRWASVPQILMYLAHDPLGPWELAGECIDQKTAQCYAEFERPFVTVQDERVYIGWSTWKNFSFWGRDDRTWHIASRDIGERYCSLQCMINIGLYGAQRLNNKVMGWWWMDRKNWTATCYVGDCNWSFSGLPKVSYWG